VGTPTATSAPLHVAIIMDGNGRWAKARGLPRVAGHRQGVEAVRSIVDAAPDLGVTHLTLYGFSTENWQRPEAEVSALMGLLRLYLRNEARKLHKDNVQVRFIGQKELISPDLQDLMDKTTALTASNTRLVLTIALSYGGRWDIACAMQRLAEQVKDGSLSPQDITESNISAALSTSGIPDPDLLIRTSGEQRVSNFLLWQCAYAEMIFTDTLWPDFNGKRLSECIDQFGNRDRRFGTITA
jgi:undecaprenyl diphosphate synthase